MKFTPADNYKDLLVQAHALARIVESKESVLKIYREDIKRLSEELALTDPAELLAERETNVQLTNALLLAEQTIDELRKQHTLRSI